MPTDADDEFRLSQDEEIRLRNKGERLKNEYLENVKYDEQTGEPLETFDEFWERKADEDEEAAEDNDK